MGGKILSFYISEVLNALHASSINEEATESFQDYCNWEKDCIQCFCMGLA